MSYLKVVQINLLPWECGGSLSSNGKQILISGSQRKAAAAKRPTLCIENTDIFSIFWGNALVSPLRKHSYVNSIPACTNNVL